MPTKTFRLGHVLYVTTGILACEGEAHPIDGVYKILDFMTGASNFTHQLPRVRKECTPHLLAQFPQLSAVTKEGVGPHNYLAWLEDAKTRFGDAFDVASLPAGQHEAREPLSELIEMIGPERVIPIVIGNGET